MPRVDVREKVTGTGIYPDDVYLDGMIYASAVRSAYPGPVLAIHTEEAKLCRVWWACSLLPIFRDKTRWAI